MTEVEKRNEQWRLLEQSRNHPQRQSPPVHVADAIELMLAAGGRRIWLMSRNEGVGERVLTSECWSVHGKPLVLVIRFEKAAIVAWDIYKPIVDSNRLDLTFEALKKEIEHVD